MKDCRESKEKAKELVWGIAGTGWIASDMSEVLVSSGRKVRGACGRDYEKTCRFVRKYGMEKAYRTFEEMLADPLIDCVYIATPHSLHASMMEQSIAAGKHVFCEKALALNSRELAPVIQAARKNGCVIAEGTTLFHMPLFSVLEARADSGEFGRLKIINVQFGSLKENNPHNRFFDPKQAGGAMYDIGVYALGLVRTFMHPPLVSIKSEVVRHETGVDESCAIVMKNKEGALAGITLSLLAKQPKRAAVSFEKAWIEISDYPRAQKANIFWNDGRMETVEVLSSVPALLCEVQDFEDAIRGQKPVHGFEKAVDVIDWITQIMDGWKDEDSE